MMRTNVLRLTEAPLARPVPRLSNLSRDSGEMPDDHEKRLSTRNIPGHNHFPANPSRFEENRGSSFQLKRNETNQHVPVSSFYGQRQSPALPNPAENHFVPSAMSSFGPNSHSNRNVAPLSLDGLKNQTVNPFPESRQGRKNVSPLPKRMLVDAGMPTMSPTFDKNHLFFRQNGNLLAKPNSSRNLNDSGNLSTLSTQRDSNSAQTTPPHGSFNSGNRIPRQMDLMYPNPFPYDIPNRFALISAPKVH